MEMTRAIAGTVAGTTYEKLPPEVVDTTKKFILDTLGVGLAGLSAPGCREMSDLFGEQGGKAESSVLGGGTKLPAPQAAFLNSMFCHALDFDDTLDDAAMHCYVNVLPPVLALSESRGNVSGKALIVAVAVGVDLCARLALAVKTPLSWIRTATCGSFAAAAAAAKILELDEERIINALGIVYSQTSGNAQTLVDGGLTKRMQPAFSARAGALSALMAQKGITGARIVFEGVYGYYNLYEKGAYDPQAVYEGLGRDFYGMKLSIKPYPSCRMTHSSIDAALLLRDKYTISYGEIEKVEVYVSKMCREMVGEPFAVRSNPQVDAQFSIPYTVGVALSKGKPVMRDFLEENIRREESRAAADRVKVYCDGAINEKDLKPALLKVFLKNGRVLEMRTQFPKGHPQNPLTWEECIAKFRECADASEKKYRKEKVECLIETVLNLEKLPDTAGKLVI